MTIYIIIRLIFIVQCEGSLYSKNVYSISFIQTFKTRFFPFFRELPATPDLDKKKQNTILSVLRVTHLL